MAILNVVELPAPQGAEPIGDLKVFASEDVAVSGSSAQSSAFGAETKMIRLCADVACYIAGGADPTAAAGSTHYLPANSTEYFRVSPGDKVAVIEA
jgi:hypothetical protein